MQKFNIRIEGVNGGMLTCFDGITLDAFYKWLKRAEKDLSTNYTKGQELYLKHNNSRTVNTNPNDRL